MRCFRKNIFEIHIVLPEIARARMPSGRVAVARRGRVRALRRLRGIPRMQALVLALPPGAGLAPPRLAGATFCGHEDCLGQVQSIALEVQGGDKKSRVA